MIGAALGAATSLAAPIIGKAGAKAPPKPQAAMPTPTNTGNMASNTGSATLNFAKPTPMTQASYAQEKLKNTAPGGGYG